MKLKTHSRAENMLIIVGGDTLLFSPASRSRRPQRGSGSGGRPDPCGSVPTDRLMHRAEVQ